jgi:hypothetical protein
MPIPAKLGYQFFDNHLQSRYCYTWVRDNPADLIDQLQLVSNANINEYWWAIENVRTPSSDPVAAQWPIQLTQCLYVHAGIPARYSALWVPEMQDSKFGSDEIVGLPANIAALNTACSTHLLDREGQPVISDAGFRRQERGFFHDTWPGIGSVAIMSVRWINLEGRGVRLNHFQDGPTTDIIDNIEGVSNCRYTSYFTAVAQAPTVSGPFHSPYLSVGDIVRLRYLCEDGSQTSVCVAAPDGTIFGSDGKQVDFSLIPDLNTQILAVVTNQVGSPAVSHLRSFRRRDVESIHNFFQH